jgi:hypothetical protein
VTAPTRRPAHSARRPQSSVRRVLVLSGLALLGVLLAVAVWTGIRGALAVSELKQALPLATQLQASISAGDTESLGATGAKLTGHAAAAAALTSDVIWRGAEFVPWVGANLTVMRELAGAVDDVTRDGLAPLTTLASTMEPSSFTPVEGRINLQPLLAIQPAVAQAAEALRLADERVNAVDVSQVIGPLVDAHSSLSKVLGTTTVTVDALNRAVRLLPEILGASGPRNYVVLFQNNAELRATGGIPGALALIHTDNGSFELAQQASSADFPWFASPVLDLPFDTRALYGDNTAQYIQDVNFTPRFDLTGQLTREMWSQRFGLLPDGVLSIDPVALSYLLEATGDVTLPTGQVLTSDNAVALLLQDVYADYPDPSDQDAFFAGAAAAVFTTIAQAKMDPGALIAALVRSGAERRVFVWSANAEDQEILAGTTLAGGLPVSTKAVENFGVYFNDTTGSKMGPYLDVGLGAGAAICRNDGRATFEVVLTLTNTAPLDAGTRLPRYVTGGGGFGTPPGDINMSITVYGSPGAFNVGVTRDGLPLSYQPTVDGEYPLSKIVVALTPQESTVLMFRFLGAEPGLKAVGIENTPFAYATTTQKVAVACNSDVE